MANGNRTEWDDSAYITIRRRRDALLRPLSLLLVRLGVPAPVISLLGVALAGVTCWSLEGSSLAAFGAFLGALVCDALDGAVARQSGTESPAGKVVDHACDTATFLLVLLAIGRSGLSSISQISVSALLAIPLLLLAIQVRRKRSQAQLEPSGGFLAHVYKVPIYGAFLLYTAGGANLLEPAVRVANFTAGFSLLLVVAAVFLTSRRTAAAAPTPQSRS